MTAQVLCESASRDVHSTRLGLPQTWMTDGFHVPVFDHRRILTVSTCPVGEGGQATVWACEVRDGDVEESPRPGDRLEGRREGSTGRTRMALKVLRPTLAASESERQAFGREAHFLSRISHEHVCKAVGRWTTTTGLPCLVLTWCGMDVSRAMSLKDVGSSSKARRRAREHHVEPVRLWRAHDGAVRERRARDLREVLELLDRGLRGPLAWADASARRRPARARRQTQRAALL